MEHTPRFQAAQARSKGPRLGLIAFVCIFLLGLGSCSEDPSAGLQKKRHTGAPGEVLVVMQPQYWTSAAGDTLRKHLSGIFPMTPQPEQALDIVHIPSDKFGGILRHHRNIVIVDIADNERNIEANTSLAKDKWATGQLVYTIAAVDSTAFIDQMIEIGPTLQRDILAKDVERIKDYVGSIEDPELQGRLKDHLGVELTLHRDFNWLESGKNWAWMSRERIEYLSGTGHDVKQGLFIYSYPYTSDSLFTVESQIKKRNEVLGEHILSNYDVGMTVENRYFDPEGQATDFKGQFAYEMRGLWRFDRPIMGGPFMSLSVVDQQKGRVITVDGYVFAPKFNKKKYMLELEAVLRSLTF